MTANFLAYFNAASLASNPELQKKAELSPAREQSFVPSCSCKGIP